MREGIKRTPMELLRAVIEEQGCEMPCGTLHEIHGDRRNICGDRNCIECKLDAMRKAADLVEAELDALKARSLPEGMEWPCYEDGEPVRFGDMALIDGDADMVEAVQLWIHGKPVIYGDGGSQQLERGERVKRPAPKVVDADGVEIREGDRLYDTDTGCGRTVRAINASGTVEFEGYEDRGWFTKFLTHRAPVLAADGEPLREGETVYVCVDYPYGADIVTGEAVSVRSAYGSNDAEVMDRKGDVWFVDANQLTHKPFDSWERLEYDATRPPRDYCGMLLNWAIDPGQDDAHYIEGMAEDLVRRARALAERERGER